jgi:hypothetical protein
VLTASFVGELIPLRRIKTILVANCERLTARFAPVEKSPPKSRELRFLQPGARIARRVAAPVVGLGELKFVQRARRHAKLHLFRMWKLFGQLKDERAETAYRPVAERMREARALLRL